MTFDTKPMRQYPAQLSHVATLLWEINNSNLLQIFNRYGKMQTNCNFIASNFVMHPQILIFSVFKIASFFPILITNEIFHVTVLLLVYFCNQFVAPDIRHTRCHCSVCQQSIWYTATRSR